MPRKKKESAGLEDEDIIRKYESGARDVAALMKQLLDVPGDAAVAAEKKSGQHEADTAGDGACR